MARSGMTVGETGLVKQAPVIYQDDRTAPEVEGMYVVEGNTIRFEIGQYDRARSLVIDPIVVFFGYLGGTDGSDDIMAAAQDTSGDIYVTGATQSTNFPTVAPVFGSTNDGDDAFITKISGDGQTILYSTYIGGDGFDVGQSITVDSTGRAYVGGITGASDYPTTLSAFDTTLGNITDGVLTVLNAAGSALVYSSYFGGTDDFVGEGVEGFTGIGVDANGLAYLGGSTDASDYPVTVGALRENAMRGGSNFSDCSVTVVDPDLSGAASLIYGTYLGSTTADEACSDLVYAGGTSVAIVGQTFGRRLSDHPQCIRRHPRHIRRCGRDAPRYRRPHHESAGLLHLPRRR